MWCTRLVIYNSNRLPQLTYLNTNQISSEISSISKFSNTFKITICLIPLVNFSIYLNSKSSFIKRFRWNLNGIALHDFVKMPLIKAFIIARSFDIICFSETFLDSSIGITSVIRQKGKFQNGCCKRRIFRKTNIFYALHPPPPPHTHTHNPRIAR